MWPQSEGAPRARCTEATSTVSQEEIQTPVLQRFDPHTPTSMKKGLNNCSGSQKLTDFYLSSLAHIHQDCDGGSYYSTLAPARTDPAQPAASEICSTGPLSPRRSQVKSTPPDSPTTRSPSKTKKSKQGEEDSLPLQSNSALSVIPKQKIQLGMYVMRTTT